MNPRSLRVALALALSLAPAVAQSQWSIVPTGGPLARGNHAMAFDSQRHRTVLFGGGGAGGTQFGDTWEWDGASWVQVSASGPPSRLSHSMVYDSARQRTVLFGGVRFVSGTAVFLQDTWEWDGAAWTQYSDGPTRGSHAMAFDVQRGKTVMFGGHVGSAVYVGDTWEWDGTTWTQVSTTGPAVRAYHAMTYDAVRGKALLFGGHSTGSGWVSYGDTWEWDGLTWTLVATTGPSPRSYHAMTYVSHVNRTVMYGGFSGFGVLPETWEWDGSGWTQVAGASPSPHHNHSLVYDSHRGMVILFGGYGGATLAAYAVTSETWARPCGPIVGVSAAATSYGAGCGTPTPSFAPSVGSRPLLGQTQHSDIDNATFGFAAVAWGLTNQSLPLDFLGINGCTLWNGAEMEVGSFCASTSFNSAQHSLPIPFDATLIGVHVYLQAWTLAPELNPVGVKLSNGIELLLGDI